MRNKGQPSVSIVLPVYNGARFLQQAIDDLLSQDMEDFELIVSDNASVDETPDILWRAANRDSRMRVIRQPKNVGAARNFELLIPHARAPYIMFGSHDDRWHPTFIRTLREQLETNPLAVMAHADAMAIDEHSNFTGTTYPSMHTVGLGRFERIRAVLGQFAWLEFYSLMRTNALRAVQPFKHYVGGDVIFLMNMNILGEIAAVREPLFLYRIPSTKSTAGNYYASLVPSTPQDPRTYNALVRHLYRALFDYRLELDERVTIREIFIDQLSEHNRPWLTAIAAERGTPMERVTKQVAVQLITELLDEAEEQDG